MKYLLFQVYGILQAWGLPLPGVVRKTDDHPTKAAILGLTAACLGIRPDQEEELRALNESIKFACRVDAEGSMLEDFHTVSREGVDTICSQRYYLCDAVFTVCLWEDSPFHLEQISKALRKPMFMPFLGRKACSHDLPFAPSIVEEPSLLEAFNSYSPAYTFLSTILSTGKVPLYWEGDDDSVVVEREIRRNDVLVSRKRWKYRSRLEKQGFIQMPKEESCISVN